MAATTVSGNLTAGVLWQGVPAASASGAAHAWTKVAISASAQNINIGFTTSGEAVAVLRAFVQYVDCN